jgi:hypothetical protein
MQLRQWTHAITARKFYLCFEPEPSGALIATKNIGFVNVMMGKVYEKSIVDKQ